MLAWVRSNMDNFSHEVLPNKKKRELGTPESMKHLNGKFKYMENLILKSPNRKGGEQVIF